VIIAGVRHVPNIGSVAIINIFLGWTFIGWIVALAMACRSVPPVHQVNVIQQPPQPFYAQRAPTPLAAPPGLAPPAMSTPNTPTVAGWHPDPLGRSRLRYFDGAVWTDHVSN
jgi:hypothetical protein